MDDLLKEFLVEALELAVNVEEHLMRLERAPGDLEILNAVFRSFHTIKGGAGFMGLPAIVAACHLTENLFDALRTGAAPVTPSAIEAALETSAFVADQLQSLQSGVEQSALPTLPRALELALEEAIAGKASGAPAGATTPSPVPAPSPKAPLASSFGDNVNWQAYYEAALTEGAPEPQAQAQKHTTEAVSVAQAPTPSAPAPSADATERKGAPAKEESIRIDATKLDTLLEVAGETVQAANQAAVLVEKLGEFKFEGKAGELMAALQETLSRASRYSNELQRATLATRMQPVGRLFQKFPRLVRELAKELGKDVELVIEGAETEVDRVVVDSLYDPLVHMLRNSLDHGIESREERLASGKVGKATILLKAWQESNSVMIVISDDGKGMNPQVLRNKAIAKRLIGEHEALQDHEAFQLVFLPGFSTKDVASSVSGRGVGMDVVRTAVEKHRGSIKIDSELGAGTRFSVRLPIELSIVPTMLVSAGTQMGLPIATIERVVELPESLNGVGGEPVLMDQGRPLPVRSLGRTLGYAPQTERVGIVIACDKPYILAVTSVDGTADLVIKPLTALVTQGITGTARSAEGDLVLVVGPGFLLNGCK
jgi:two-component system chemotaxis sensor kinase CheA